MSSVIVQGCFEACCTGFQIPPCHKLMFLNAFSILLKGGGVRVEQ